MLFSDITVMLPDFTFAENMYVATEKEKIAYVGNIPPVKDYGEKYNGRGKILLPGLYNSHAHTAMTLLRGVGGGLPLERWLNEAIFPREALLTPADIYNGTMLGIAEMLRFGTVSFTDMYYYTEDIIRAVNESGIKANVSLPVLNFSDGTYESMPEKNINEYLYKEYHNSALGRIKTDYCIHGEYTSNEKVVRGVSEHAGKNGVNVHIHLAETKKETEQCLARHGKTPTRYFYDAGLFNNRVTAAHCVWLTDEDISLIAENSVFAALCPASNLKLASGICRLPDMLSQGVSCCLGTDGVASNNNLDMFRSMYLLSVICNNKYESANAVSCINVLKAATLTGALSQGRDDCGTIAEGNRADLCIMNTDVVNMHPCESLPDNIVFSAMGSDIVLTMVDGRVLYKNGEYTTIDRERVIYNAKVK